MKKLPFGAEIKVRVTVEAKRLLEMFASVDEMELSDEVRIALRDYLNRRKGSLTNV